MAAETFELLNEKEKAIRGVIETLHPTKAQPAIIFLNGFLETKESPITKRLSDSFLKEGYVTVRFDYAYSFSTEELARFTLTNQVQDATQVLEHVIRRGYVDSRQIAVVGYCFGGMAAILLAAFDERVTALQLLNAPYWFEDTHVTRIGEHELSRIKLKRYFHLTHRGKEVRIDYAFIEDGAKKDMARATRNLRQPTLIIHGRQDESIPVMNAQEIHDRVPAKKKLIIIETMRHLPSEKELKQLIPQMIGFLKKHLK